MTKCFKFNKKYYYAGTVVKIRDGAEKHVGFCSMLTFIGYNTDNNLYIFQSFYDIWKRYEITEKQLEEYIEYVAKAYCASTQNEKKEMDPKYVDGIVSAWIWYVLIMFFAFFVKGIENVILIWIAASVAFWGWRHKKIKGE
jgi:hypothetical protein